MRPPPPMPRLGRAPSRSTDLRFGQRRGQRGGGRERCLLGSVAPRLTLRKRPVHPKRTGMGPPPRRPPTAPQPKRVTEPAVRPKKLYRAKEERPALAVKAAVKQNAAASKEHISRANLQSAAAAAGLSGVGRAVPLAQLTRKELQGVCLDPRWPRALAARDSRNVFSRHPYSTSHQGWPQGQRQERRPYQGPRVNGGYGSRWRCFHARRLGGIGRRRRQVCTKPGARRGRPPRPVTTVCPDLVACARASHPIRLTSGVCWQLDSLKALGILGKTPGGTQWRQKVKKTHSYNTRAAVAEATGGSSVLAEFKI